jgi:hypothetical protein
MMNGLRFFFLSFALVPAFGCAVATTDAPPAEDNAAETTTVSSASSSEHAAPKGVDQAHTEYPSVCPRGKMLCAGRCVAYSEVLRCGEDGTGISE